jgi:nucleoside-diphosphate kinase
MERTLVLLKPDCIQRRLAGKLIARFEDKGLAIVAMKLMQVDKKLAAEHYAEHVKKPFYPSLEAFITGGPIVAMVLEGIDAIQVVRDMLGATSGLKAAPGTIRGDYSASRQMNLVHASDGPEAAQREQALYFSPSEFCDSKLTLRPWLRAADEE